MFELQKLLQSRDMPIFTTKACRVEEDSAFIHLLTMVFIVLKAPGMVSQLNGLIIKDLKVLIPHVHLVRVLDDSRV